jgi:formylglycine-generating enzyme required for sulfatase activity
VQTVGPQITLYYEDHPVSRFHLMPESAQQLYNYKLTLNYGEFTSVPDSLTLTVFPVQRQVLPEPDESNLIPPFMLIGDPGNSPDRVTGFGTVNTIFEISTTEVSNVQYVGFLNSVAKDDPQSLFSPLMESDPRGGIVRSGVSGSYFYESKPYMAVKPVNFVSWINAARFVNWLENDMPEGEQGQLTTETGTYNLTIQDAATAAVRGPDSRYALPEENEWFKAAYYDPAARFYRQYPLRIDGLPQRAAASSSGNVRNPGPRVTNFANGALWFGMQGNVTSVASTQAASAYGTYNQGGNVAEWLDNPAERSMRIIRGGHYGASVEEVSSSGRTFHEPDYTGPAVGFRVVRSLCFADLNGDGDVDAEDVNHFSLEYGRTNCGDVDMCKGDFDGDGDVDGSDLTEFSTCLGEFLTHSLKIP